MQDNTESLIVLGLTFDEAQKKKQELITKYKSLTTFKERFSLWYGKLSDNGWLNSSLMCYRGYDRSNSLVIEYQEIRDNQNKFNDSVSESRLMEIRKIWENEDITDGLVEPIPKTDDDKEYLVLQFCKILNSTYETELSFDEYKSKFNQEVQNKLDPKEYAENELRVIKESLDKNFNVDINHRNGTTLRDLVYYMTNNNFKIDYLFFYNEYHLRYNFRDIILILSKIVYAVQYQRFLEIWLKNYKEEDKSLIANNLNQSSEKHLDLNLEDFKEIFIKSHFAETTVSIQDISHYFELELVKFKNRFSNENLTQRIKDIIFKRFIKGIEEANSNLSNHFIEYEEKRFSNIWQLKAQGTDISEIEEPSRYNLKIPLPYLCKKFGFGIHLELKDIEFINMGFELFKQQHEESSSVKQYTSTTSLEPEEDFVKLFLDSFAGKEINDIKQIAIYFQRESVKFINKNTKENSTSEERDLMLGEFLEKVEYAKKEIDKPFLRYEKMHLDRIYDAESKGIDTSKYFVPDLSKTKLQMFEIYRPYRGELYYSEVQWVYQGFELFKLQHEMDSYVSTPTPKKQQTGFNLGYSETQLIALHKALIDNNFLNNQTKEAHFINAFNGKVLTNFEKLKWIDKTPKNNAGEAGFNTQTLLEFLYLLEMEAIYYDTLPSNQENFYRLIERVFKGIVNIQPKNVTKTANQKTQRQKLLKTILQSIKS